MSRPSRIAIVKELGSRTPRCLAAHAVRGEEAELVIVERYAATLGPDVLAIIDGDAKALTTLVHPNLATLISTAKLKGDVAVLSEWVDGESLAAMVDWGERPPTDVLVRVMLDVLEGLGALHALSRVCGPFTPEDVFVGADGVARLTRFGLGRVGARLLSLRRAENAAPDSERTPRADIYTAGLLLRECSRHLSGDASAAGLAAVVDKAVAADPLGRYATPGEMAAALTSSGLKAATRGAVAQYVARTFGERIATRRTRFEPKSDLRFSTSAPPTTEPPPAVVVKPPDPLPAPAPPPKPELAPEPKPEPRVRETPGVEVVAAKRALPPTKEGEKPPPKPEPAPEPKPEPRVRGTPGVEVVAAKGALPPTKEKEKAAVKPNGNAARPPPAAKLATPRPKQEITPKAPPAVVVQKPPSQPDIEIPIEATAPTTDRPPPLATPRSKQEITPKAPPAVVVQKPPPPPEVEIPIEATAPTTDRPPPPSSREEIDVDLDETVVRPPPIAAKAKKPKSVPPAAAAVEPPLADDSSPPKRGAFRGFVLLVLGGGALFGGGLYVGRLTMPEPPAATVIAPRPTITIDAPPPVVPSASAATSPSSTPSTAVAPVSAPDRASAVPTRAPPPPDSAKPAASAKSDASTRYDPTGI